MCKLAVLIGVVIVFVTASRIAGQDNPACLPADAKSSFYESVLVDITSSTDTESVLLRQSLQLPEITPAAVALTTNPRVCGRAVAALAAEQGKFARRQLYVFTLGVSHYAVVDVQPPPPPNVFVSAYTPVWFFDSTWAFLSVSGI